MDFRTAAEAVLRAHSSIFHSFRPALNTRPYAFQRFAIGPGRQFSSRPFLQAQDTAAKGPELPSSSSETVEKPESSGIPNDVNRILQDSLDGGSQSPSTQARQYSGEPSDRLSTESGDSSSSLDFSSRVSGTSADRFAERFARSEYSWPSNRRAEDRRRASFLDTSSMQTPQPTFTSDNPLITYRQPVIIPEPTIKLGPSVGRTVAIEPNKGVDLGRGFRMLEMLCARNKVRTEFKRQRFHERPGLKRKRLKSERWRRRFREGFKAVVQRVERLKKQGW